MKVGINTFGCDHGRSGIGSYIHSLVRNIPDSGHSVELFGPELDRFTYNSGLDSVEYSGLAVSDSILAERGWHVTGYPSFVRKRKYDAVLFPAGIRLLPLKFEATPVVVIQDIIRITSYNVCYTKLLRLRGAERIVRHFVKLRRDEILAVVCGRNRLLRRQTRHIVERSGANNVLVFGFVDFMADLLNIADAVITKGGASTVLEVLATGKPIIFSTYIRGQELGNVLYAVYNGVGWYIKKPRDILEKAFTLTEDDALRGRLREKIDSLGIRNGLEEMASFIHEG